MVVDPADPAPPPPGPTARGGGRSLVDRANRRPAPEQLASARARIDAARTRMPRGGTNARGVDLALAGGVLACLVAGAAIGLGMVELGSSDRPPAARVVVWDNAATLARLAGVAPSEQLVVINDLKEPLPPQVRAWVATLERALAAAGCTMAGEASTGGDPTEESMSRAAALRLSVAPAAPGEPEGANRMAAWLKDHPQVGAVVWVAPTLGEPDGTPTVTLARGGMDDAMWARVSQLVQEQAGGTNAQ